MKYTKAELKKMLQEAEREEQERLKNLLNIVSEIGVTDKAISDISSVSQATISNFKKDKGNLSEESAEAIVDSIKQIRDKLSAAIDMFNDEVGTEELYEGYLKLNSKQ